MSLRPRYASFELLLYNELLDKLSQFVVESGMKVASAAPPCSKSPSSLRNLCVTALSFSSSRSLRPNLTNRDNRKSFISNVYKKLWSGHLSANAAASKPSGRNNPRPSVPIFPFDFKLSIEDADPAGISTSLPELLLAQAMSGVSPLSATLTKNSGVVGSTPPQPAPNGQPATELHLAEAMSGVSPLSAMLTKKPGVGCYAQPEAAAEPYCASRFTIDTRNCGLAFSAGSISYVCAVFVGS